MCNVNKVYSYFRTKTSEMSFDRVESGTEFEPKSAEENKIKYLKENNLTDDEISQEIVSKM